MDPVQVRPHPAVCVKPLVPVIRFFFPRMLDFGGRQVHRQVDARAEHGRRPTEFALPNRVPLDLRHRVLDALPVVIDPRVDCHHCPVENLPSCQAEPGEHTEAPDKEQETRKSNPPTLLGQLWRDSQPDFDSRIAAMILSKALRSLAEFKPLCCTIWLLTVEGYDGILGLLAAVEILAH